jgi:hypothetical protein
LKAQNKKQKKMSSLPQNKHKLLFNQEKKSTCKFEKAFIFFWTPKKFIGRLNFVWEASSWSEETLVANAYVQIFFLKAQNKSKKNVIAPTKHSTKHLYNQEKQSKCKFEKAFVFFFDTKKNTVHLIFVWEASSWSEATLVTGAHAKKD